MNTKKYVQGMACTLACIAAFTLTSCGSDSFLSDEEAITHITHQAPQTIKAVAPGADTRVSYEETDEGNISVKWKQGDEIILYSPSTQTQLTYRYNGAEESVDAEFELTGEGGELDGEFYAYYGVETSLDEYSSMYYITKTASAYNAMIPSEPHVVQTGDNTFEHLIPYNAMSAKGVCANGAITEPIRFQSLMSLVRLNINMPAGKTPKVFGLITHDYNSLMLNNTFVNGNLYAMAMSSGFVLDLENISTNTFTANMLLVPRDMSYMTLFAFVEDENGDFYVSDAMKGANFEEGKWYEKSISVEEAFEGEGTVAAPWLIKDRNDWVKFLAFGNGVGLMNGEYFKLMNDINVENLPPVASIAVNLDGNGKCISGVGGMIGWDGFYKTGLFGYYTGGSIKDLTVQGRITPSGYGGGIAEHMQNVTFAGHVISDVDIETKQSYSSDSYTGGIAGYMSNCTMEDGAILENRGDLTSQIVGGIAGFVDNDNFLMNRMNGTIINRGNINSVVLPYMYSASFLVSAGGFIGLVYYGNTEYQFSESSQSLGNITCTSTSSDKWAFAGWIAGVVYAGDILSYTQLINEGYEGTPEINATNVEGGIVYINGVQIQ